MGTIKLNAGMASGYFVTELKGNLALLDNPYLVFSSMQLTKNILSEILMRTYNMENQKGFLGIMPKQAAREPIEQLLDDLIAERRYSSETLMGSRRPLLIFANGIEKQCLFSMKALKVRGLVFLAAINARSMQTEIEQVKNSEEIKSSEIYRDAMLTIFSPDKMRAVIGRHKTVLAKNSPFNKLVSENPDVATVTIEAKPITDKAQIVDEGIYD